MKNELEARIEHFRRCSLTEELANKPDDFGWWVVANYGEALLFQNDKTMLKEGREYVSQLSLVRKIEFPYVCFQVHHWGYVPAYVLERYCEPPPESGRDAIFGFLPDLIGRGVSIAG